MRSGRVGSGTEDMVYCRLTVRAFLHVERALVLLPLSPPPCRGVQVLYPFFSLWSTPQTRLLAVSSKGLLHACMILVKSSIVSTRLQQAACV